MNNYRLGIDSEEKERLLELFTHEILDADPDAEFQELVELASQICCCPIAAIIFIGKEVPWTKAITGVGKADTAGLNSLLASHILSGDPVVVKDTFLDERFLSQPGLNEGVPFRFYAALPVYSRKKKKLGAVCVADHRPGQLTKAQVAALRLVSIQVTNLLELRLRNRILQKYSRRALRNSEQSYESFLNLTGQPKWIYDLDTLQVLQVNQAMIDKYGYSRDEFLQMVAYEIRTDEEKKWIHQLVKSIKDNNRPSHFITKHQTKDGRILDVEVSVIDIVYMGKAARMATIVDITEIEQLRKEKWALEQKVREAVVAAREEERDLIARELHDNINQILASVKLYLDMAENYEEMRLDMIRRCNENVRTAINEVRLLSHTLVAPAEAAFHLHDAIRELINTYAVANTFTVFFSERGAVEKLPEDLKINIFRIIQEQFTNIHKHAQASDVRLTLEVSHLLVLQMSDNGKGFETKARREGIGLSNIKKRVEFYRGGFRICTAPGQGTTLIIEIPLETKKGVLLF